MNSKYYPVAFILLIGMAMYILYGDAFVPKVDLAQYKDVCIQYRDAAAGVYSQDEFQMLVNQVNYLLPDNITELSDSLEVEVKNCAAQLEKILQERREPGSL